MSVSGGAAIVNVEGRGEGGGEERLREVKVGLEDIFFFLFFVPGLGLQVTVDIDVVNAEK
jgi:hypothetical protein